MFGSKIRIIHDNDTKIRHEQINETTVDSWFLMGSPWLTVIIVACYLYFVLKLGPDLMKKRQAFSLKYTLILYNLAQVVYNAAMLVGFFHARSIILHTWIHSNEPANLQENPLISTYYQLSWYFMLSKFLDLLDTVFFVLRKKQSQVTLLHVYHHTIMALFTWGFVKYSKGQQGALAGLINSAVHVVMYGYYFLSAFGPQVQKYLWWKKYITKIQLGQFIIIMSYLGMLTYNCNLSKSVTIFMFVNTGIFLILFLDFYYKAYIKSAKNDTAQSTGSSRRPNQTSNISSSLFSNLKLRTWSCKQVVNKLY